MKNSKWILVGFFKIFVLLHFMPSVLEAVQEKTRFAILIGSYNNEKWCEWNLESVLNQDYNPEYFHIYYGNDGSTDNTLTKAQAYVNKEGKKDLITFIDNPLNKGAAQNYYDLTYKYVDDDCIVVILDGDDAFAHNGVLKYLDQIYSDPKKEIWMTYGQYQTEFDSKRGKDKGHCCAIPLEIEENFLFRKYRFVQSHLRTYYAWLFKKIKKEDLMYKGTFLQMSWDVASMIPMMEMSLGHYHFIPDILYLYNCSNPISDQKKNVQYQLNLEKYVKRLPSYDPLDVEINKKLKKRLHLRRKREDIKR